MTACCRPPTPAFAWFRAVTCHLGGVPLTEPVSRPVSSALAIGDGPCEFHSRVETQLAKDLTEMKVHRVARQMEQGRRLQIGPALGHGDGHSSLGVVRLAQPLTGRSPCRPRLCAPAEPMQGAFDPLGIAYCANPFVPSLGLFEV